MPKRNRGLRVVQVLIGGATGGIIISILLMASVPPVSRDALVHHLAVPIP